MNLTKIYSIESFQFFKSIQLKVKLFFNQIASLNLYFVAFCD